MQDWLRNPAGNYGWMLITQSEDLPKSARRFAAREYPQANSRPALTIEYSAPPGIPEPVITSIALMNGYAAITFAASAGVRYELQARDVFGRGEWTTLVSRHRAVPDEVLTLTNELGAELQRFYRVLARE
jgi:hypothetical protein